MLQVLISYKIRNVLIDRVILQYRYEYSSENHVLFEIPILSMPEGPGLSTFRESSYFVPKNNFQVYF